MYYTAVFLGGEWSMVDFSPSGKCLCVVVSLLGVALFAMPAGLLFEAFGDVSGLMVLTKCEPLDDYGRSSSKVAGGESDHVV
ncbi:hypothetical protein Pmar_PMAR028790 [Perkinsus marinus ATCC 50983]|uniref:Uncharacterized protein n=1 Tax=Perkinsus marinus (strain ATCC 50983 / TXsc) TaxID=423536 RepID=C5LRQ8_PERM5|nr:hypothetical protein Pmar_PMAR028790 [Perkinsus marinus ATCC 50983]EER00586.1 hypothetical protein Pmar_PMAR028790 [Perkinsus marinus ATCC 50983]|eukprot:XP_002767868.1 hypothetical protein Pmar_PMAR028790 [Perkinsus marinus ATCC 50983]